MNQTRGSSKTTPERRNRYDRLESSLGGGGETTVRLVTIVVRVTELQSEVHKFMTEVEVNVD